MHNADDATQLSDVDPLNMFRLDGQVAIVTGASSGLGERFARVLAAAGAQVVVAARRVERIRALADDLPGGVAIECDVSEDSSLVNLVGETYQRFGRIDVLVNNAGISDGVVAAEKEDMDLYRRVIEVNLNAVFRLSQLSGAYMLEATSGSIINIASVHGIVAAAPMNEAAYASSKGGVVMLTRELGAQWARRGVRVNAIAPGYFPTELNQELFESVQAADWLRRNTPIGRPGRHDELDGALLLLASRAGTFIAGQTIVVDGGFTIR